MLTWFVEKYDLQMSKALKKKNQQKKLLVARNNNCYNVALKLYRTCV